MVFSGMDHKVWLQWHSEPYDGSHNRNLQGVYSNFQTPGMYYLILEKENYKSVSVKGLEMGALPGIAYEMGALSA